MPVSNEDRNVVENMFKAMQAGPEGENAMMALFASDAVFVEPFSGEVKTHEGADAIRTSFQEMWKEPAPDMKLMVDRVDIDGDRIRADWTCTSPAFATPMRGHDLFNITGGKIARLEVVVTDMPPMEGPPEGQK